VNCLSHRHHRRGLSLWLVVALLFKQIATSAYGCPGGMFPGAGDADAEHVVSIDHDAHAGHGAPRHATTAMPDDMVDCDMSTGLGTDTPQLCKLHCEPANQTTLHASASNDAPAAPLLWAVLDWSPGALPHHQLGNTPRLGVVSGAPPPGAPPLYLSLLVLRN
jgi:hypothetical protein